MLKLVFLITSIVLFAVSGGHFIKSLRDSKAARIAAGSLAVILTILALLPFVEEQMESTSRKTSLADPGCSFESFAIEASQSVCGFRLGPQGELSLDGRVVSPRLVSTFSTSDATDSAIQAYIFPEPKRKRYFVIQGCEARADNLCWSVWKFDKKHWTIEKTSAGKYGPERWIRWSPDLSTAVMYNNNEGSSWLHSIYFKENYRDASSEELVGIEPFSFKWLGNNRFTIDSRIRGERNMQTHEYIIERKSIRFLR